MVVNNINVRPIIQQALQNLVPVGIVFAIAVYFACKMDCFGHPNLKYCVLLLVILGVLYHQMIHRTIGLPPGPRPLPFVGNSLSINLSHPSRSFSAWRKNYGPIFTVWLPNQPIIVLASHEVLKEALVVKGHAFAGRPMGYVWSMFTKNREHGDGIILCDGQRWEALRGFASKILKKQSTDDKINFHVRKMFTNIDESQKKDENYSLNIEKPLSLCVGNIIQDIVMSKRYKAKDAEFDYFKHMIDSVLKRVASKWVQMVNAYPWMRLIPFNGPLRDYTENGFNLQRFVVNSKGYVRYFLDTIEEHKKGLQMDGDARDFIESFLREMRTHPDNIYFNELSCALSAGDLWTGGMETTVTMIRWAIAYMLYYPEVQQRCREEIEEIFGDELPSYSDRQRVPYIQATISELLRIVNVLPWAIPHRTTEEVTVQGYVLPAGITVLPQYGAVQFDPQFFPKPEIFNPERFLNAEGQLVKRTELNPFGMGRRACLGKSLAEKELFVIFTALLQRFDFQANDSRLPSLSRSDGMTNVPQPFTCLAIPRPRADGIPRSRVSSLSSPRKTTASCIDSLNQAKRKVMAQSAAA